MFHLIVCEAAQRLREAATEKAEAEKILLVKAAEAEADSKELSGKGVARQRNAMVDGLKSKFLTIFFTYMLSLLLRHF